MNKQLEYAGLIVAAGMSRRMGTCKQLMTIGEYTFIEHIVRRFQLAGVQRIVVVTGYKAKEVQETLKEYSIQFVHNDQYEHSQMFDSVKLGLTALKEKADRIFFCPVDVPFFSVETMETEKKQSEDIVFPISHHKIGHPILLSGSCIQDILDYKGNRGLKGALDSFDKERICYLPVDDPCGVIDADTKEDVELLKQLNQRNIAIFGAGQVGETIYHWISDPENVVCYIDNDTMKQNLTVHGLPVKSLEDAMAMGIYTVILAMVGDDRITAVSNQLKEIGFKGNIWTLEELKGKTDERLAWMRLYASQIEERHIHGDIAELGVFKGEFAAQLNRWFPNRELYLFDTFEGFDEADIKETVGKHEDFSQTSIELVRSKMKAPERVHFVVGHFPESVQEFEEHQYALVSLDADLYQPTIAGLNYFYPRLSEGGLLVIHDYNSHQFPGVKQAVDEYCSQHRLYPMVLPDIHGTAILLKQGGV